MESEKTAETFYDEIRTLAWSIGTLYKMGYVNNISGIGVPSVLMLSEGFDALFPEVEPVVYTDGDGITWERREIVRDGISWVDYRRV